MSISILDLVNKVKEREEDIVVIKVDVRTSEGFYNYKTKYLIIARKPMSVKYEEQLTRSVKVLEVTAGIYQEFRDLEEITKALEEVGYIVDVVEV